MRKVLYGSLVSLALLSSMSLTAFAAEEREPIGSITVDITAAYDKGDEVSEDSFSIDVDTEGVTLEGFELDYSSATAENGEEWSKYDTPVLVIYLVADDDYYFDKSSKGSFKLEGEESDFVSAKRSSDKDYIELTVRLDSLQGEIGNVSNLYWDNTSVGHWDKGFNNKEYDVRLYYNGSLYKSFETKNLSFDFANNMTKVGNYYFSVRGVSSKNKSDYISSESVYIDDVMANELSKKVVDNSRTHSNTSNNNTPSSVKTGWNQTPNGWWYRHSDGSYTTNNWESIDGKWYYFDKNGYMRTGWQLVNNSWYYMNQSGHMLTGWQYIDNQWYYLTGSGQMLTGFQLLDSKWYYLNQSGQMLTNWQYINNNWYYFNGSGHMMTGWQFINGQWYYLLSDGTMKKGWFDENGRKYFFYDSGNMAVGTVNIGGIIYEFNSDGSLK